MARYTKIAKWKPIPVNFNAGRGGKKVLAFVIHSAVGSANGAFARFSNPAQKASTHFMIRQTGEIIQYVDTANTAWANGVCNRFGGPDPQVPWLPDYYNKRLGPNYVTISVELEGGAEPNVREPLTPPQYIGLRRLTANVLEEEGLGTALRHVNLLEHNQITATACPSGRVPWHRLISDEKAEEEEDNMAWIAKVANGQKRYLVTLGNGTLSKWHIPNPKIRRDLEKMLGTKTVDLDQTTLNKIEDRAKP